MSRNMPREMTLQEKHPELYLPEQNINRWTCVRVVPMQVLNLSMCRTGTQCPTGIEELFPTSLDDPYPCFCGWICMVVFSHRSSVSMGDIQWCLLFSLEMDIVKLPFYFLNCNEECLHGLQLIWLRWNGLNVHPSFRYICSLFSPIWILDLNAFLILCIFRFLRF